MTHSVASSSARIRNAKGRKIRVRRRRRAHQCSLVAPRPAAGRARRGAVSSVNVSGGAPAASTRCAVVSTGVWLVSCHATTVSAPAGTSRRVNRPARVGAGEVRRRHDQDHARHPVVDVAAELHRAGLVEDAPAAPARPCRAGSRTSSPARTSRRDGGSDRDSGTRPRSRPRPAARAARTACRSGRSPPSASCRPPAAARPTGRTPPRRRAARHWRRRRAR